PARQVTIGGLTGAAAYAAGLLPPVSERLITWFGRWTKTRGGALVKAGNLHQPGRDLRERAWRKNVREQSVVVAAQMRPRATAGLAATLAGAAVACFVVGRRLRARSSQGRRRT
ncbi:MAG: hypothetical protein JWO33_1097, partial [Caulobacteraceae bacterium]|nr:hypothetical protein [Caulobacteraceae bacterium]